MHCWKFVVILVTDGVGLTVTITFCGVPGGQPKAAGDTVYVTVSIVDPEFNSVWLIRFPLPAEKPERLGELAETVHVYVVPTTCDRF